MGSLRTTLGQSFTGLSPNRYVLKICHLSVVICQCFTQEGDCLMPQGIEKFGESYVCTHAQSLQQCLTLCDPVDYSLPGSSVHGILQARILEWVALPSSRGSF